MWLGITDVLFGLREEMWLGCCDDSLVEVVRLPFLCCCREDWSPNSQRLFRPGQPTTPRCAPGVDHLLSRGPCLPEPHLASQEKQHPDREPREALSMGTRAATSTPGMRHVRLLA
jgi:hypothetical protein